MSVLRALITGDASNLQKTLKDMEAVARRTGASIQKSMQAPSVHAGGSGAIRETLVLLREMGRGNWTRVPGSLSILISQLGLLKFVVRDNAAEAAKLALKLEAKAGGRVARMRQLGAGRFMRTAMFFDN